MYKKNKVGTTTIQRNTSYRGERLEQKVNRIVNNKEPIKDGAPLIYTDRKDGVRPEYDIRTDRWELAIDAMDKVTADKLTKRQDRAMKKEELKGDGELKAVITGSEPVQGTSGGSAS